MTKTHFARIAAALALFISVSGFTPAHAETGYRYWSFWLNSNNTWSMAMEGAGTLIPADGDLQGWRYITAPEVAGVEFAPRTEDTFEDICGSTAQESGKVRVALVIDFGDAADYAEGVTVPAVETHCAVVNEGDPASLVLASVANVRDDQGMVCGLNDLPASGCGESVEIAEPTLMAANEKTTTAPTATEEDNRIPQLLSIVLGAVVFVMAWRRMQWQKQNKQQ